MIWRIISCSIYLVVSKAMDDLDQGQINASSCQMLLKFKEPILSMIVIMCVYKAG